MSGYKARRIRSIPFDNRILEQFTDASTEEDCSDEGNVELQREKCKQWCLKEWQLLLTEKEYSIALRYMEGIPLSDAAQAFGIKRESAAEIVAYAALLLARMRSKSPFRCLTTEARRLAGLAECMSKPCSLKEEECRLWQTIDLQASKLIVEGAAARFVIQPYPATLLVLLFSGESEKRCDSLNADEAVIAAKALGKIAATVGSDAALRSRLMGKAALVRALCPVEKDRLDAFAAELLKCDL
jgi:hypothetical protein